MLGRWPLLVDLAARHLHSDDLSGEEGIADVDQGTSRAVEPAELGRRAEEMARAFEGDPTILDEAASRRRSFDRMLRRSLERLSVDAKEAFADLAVYPADADLTQSLLADLWQTDPIRTDKTIAALARVGLASLVRVTPPTLRLHDLITTWLHQQYGSPEDRAHNELHRRCARLAMTPDGAPGYFTEDRAAWLAFHLCRTDTLADPAALLRITWRRAYRSAAGSDALYLAALRDVARHYATRRGMPLAEDDYATRGQLTAWTLKAALFHAHLSALAGEIPGAALATQALLGQPEAASHQAASNPNQEEAGAALLEIFITLHDHGRLAPRDIELVTRLIRELPDRIAHEILAEIARILAATDLDAALAIAESIRGNSQRDWALAGIAQALASTDPDRGVVIAKRISEATSREKH